ncbi:efflux RND transporter permease subunit [Microbacterium sp.]|uniref:efflux RND transporter permease subunit n=1 Tax=Microbacterium sp. TaxID=51671 RepID=UPI003736BF07
MSNLAVLSLKNRALIALITIVAAIFGGLALTNLKQELIPSIELPQLSILTTYPGASPDVVNNDVSTPIEQAIQSVPDLEGTSATSTTNASIIQASFAYGTNLATAEQKITQAIGRIDSTLPEGIDTSVLAFSTDDLPVIALAITGFDDADELQSRLENSVVPDIEDLDGVAAAQIIGGQTARVTVVPDQAALAAAGYTQTAITDALDQNGVLFPGGTVDEGDQTFTVQTGTKVASVEEIADLPLVPSNADQFAAGAFTVGDVAEVTLGEDPVESISRVDGEPALTVSITKLPSANTVEVSDAVTEALPELREALGDDGVEFTIVFDQAPFIEQSIEALAQEGLLGLVFAVIVILVFLLSVRSTIVTAISIPTSVLITFVGIQAFGYSLNILTLGALTIAIGRVVDDSIVVIENIKRHYVGDADKKAAILLAVREVAAAITASTLTTVAVFLPIALVGDLTGELFRPFALTVTIAMVASLFVALTIVPVLAYWFLRPGKPIIDEHGRQVDPEDPAAPPSAMQKGYIPILRWTLKHSGITLALAVLVLGGTLAAVPLMKTNFLGDSGQNTLTVTQSLGDTASLEAQDEAAARVEEVLLEVDGVETVQTSIGSTGSALTDAFSGGGAGITYSVTTDADVDQESIRTGIQEAVADLDGIGEVTLAAQGGFGSSDIEIDVTAPDAGVLQEATDAVVAALEDEDGIEQVDSNLSASLPFVSVAVDRDKAATLGLSEVSVGALVANTMQPRQIGTVEIDDTSVTVYLQAEEIPNTIEGLRDLEIATGRGLIPLSEVATVEESEGPSSITSEGGQRTASVAATPASDDLTAATAIVTEALAELDLPDGADASIGGVVTQQQEAFGQLGLAILAAILIVYIVMVATFKSLRQPILLLISVPFAATGAILLQIVSGVPLGVASLIGVLMLVGIVVTNAIVLVDLVNQYREKGLSTPDAVIAGGARRLRPILMTALATIFALTPMGLGITGHGGFISQPLAIVVIGGLISSTVLTLLVLPALYNLVEGAKERRAAKRGEPVPAVVNAAGVAAPTLSRRERRERAAASVAGAAGGSVTGAAAVDTALVIEESPDVEIPAPAAAGDADAADELADAQQESPDIEIPADSGPEGDEHSEPDSGERHS